jgi:intron-binding protein aquarius
LQRNFNLFRLESTYEIREDITSTVGKLRPRLNNAGNDTVFTGWARMALPIYSFTITQVKKPDIGETKPALVRGEITVDLSPFSGHVRDEWEQLRDHDVLFLITVRATKPLSSAAASAARGSGHGGHGHDDNDELVANSDDSEAALHLRHSLGIKYVRGCELKHVVDERKNIIGERDKDGKVNQPWYTILPYTCQHTYT